jgi:chemotaxis receptor (MCP) glutamine deamidase CheD
LRVDSLVSYILPVCAFLAPCSPHKIARPKLNQLAGRNTNVQVTVGIAEMKVSKGAEDLIITHALGSCLGITAYDPMTRVGGMLHAMLPQGSLNADKAVENPYMFVDTGLPRLFEACLRAGAAKNRLIITVAGGAAMKSNGGGEDFFRSGNATSSCSGKPCGPKASC